MATSRGNLRVATLLSWSWFSSIDQRRFQVLLSLLPVIASCAASTDAAKMKAPAQAGGGQEPSSSVRVAEDSSRPGQSMLLATRDISPGETLFCEAPLILAKSERGIEAVSSHG